jgi:hypothetical protein
VVLGYYVSSAVQDEEFAMVLATCEGASLLRGRALPRALSASESS